LVPSRACILPPLPAISDAEGKVVLARHCPARGYAGAVDLHLLDRPDAGAFADARTADLRSAGWVEGRSIGVGTVYANARSAGRLQCSKARRVDREVFSPYIPRTAKHSCRELAQFSETFSNQS